MFLEKKHIKNLFRILHLAGHQKQKSFPYKLNLSKRLISLRMYHKYSYILNDSIFKGVTVNMYICAKVISLGFTYYHKMINNISNQTCISVKDIHPGCILYSTDVAFTIGNFKDKYLFTSPTLAEITKTKIKHKRKKNKKPKSPLGHENLALWK